MKRTRSLALAILAVSALFALLAACGKKGPVLPPVLFTPQKAADLAVRQQGQDLFIEVGYPKTTASGGTLPGLDALEVWSTARAVPAGTKPQLLDPREFAGEAKRVVTITGTELASATVGDRLQTRLPLAQLPQFTPPPLATPSPNPVVTVTPATSPSATPPPSPSPTASPTPAASPAPSASPSPTSSPTPAASPSPAASPTPSPSPSGPPVTARFFAIRTVAKGGDKSDFSNLAVIVPTATPPAPPTDVTLTPLENGIEISWTPASDNVLGHLVYRRDAQSHGYGPFLHGLRKEEGNKWLDSTARYGQRYVYTVSSAISLDPRIESALGGEHEIDYQDRFPPQPPTRLVALAEGAQVRLVWEASPSPDAIGYVVYRQDPGQEFHRVTAQPVSAREYIDDGLVAGLRYRYRVAAIDGAGNLGQASEEAEATPRGER